MNKELLADYALRVTSLLDNAAISSRDAQYFRSNDFLQNSLRDAIARVIEVPRNDEGIGRWMVDSSDRDDKLLIEMVSCFLILLRGWELPSEYDSDS